ncbi:hypothetical protein ABIE67_006990 [Streptomyces sp. V4I8]
MGSRIRVTVLPGPVAMGWPQSVPSSEVYTSYWRAKSPDEALMSRTT